MHFKLPSDFKLDIRDAPKQRLYFVALGRRRLGIMRACLMALLALMIGCSPDGPPDDVAVVSKPPAPEPEQADNLPELLGAVRQVQFEEECRQVAILEAQLRNARTRYTEQHPDVIRVRQEIERRRSGLPADGTFCAEQIEQRVRAAEQPPVQ